MTPAGSAKFEEPTFTFLSGGETPSHHGGKQGEISDAERRSAPHGAQLGAVIFARRRVRW
jgi:hypothetical protein